MLTTTIMIKLKATTLKQHQVQVQVGEIGNRIYPKGLTTLQLGSHRKIP